MRSKMMMYRRLEKEKNALHLDRNNERTILSLGLMEFASLSIKIAAGAP